MADKKIKWEDAPSTYDVRGGIFIEEYGDTASGRTTLALTAPGQISYLYFYETARGRVERVAATGKKIKWHKCGGVFRSDNPSHVQKIAWEAVQDFEDHYYDAYSWARTIIVDTHDEAWALERLGEFGALKPEKGRVETNYAAINNRWLSMLNQVRNQGPNPKVNLIMIGQTGDQWIPDPNNPTGVGKKTGRTVKRDTSAARQVGNKADIRIRTYCDLKPGKPPLFRAVIEKAGGNSEMIGLELESREIGETINFQNIVGLVTETDPADWE
jgi:hypothetical protein